MDKSTHLPTNTVLFTEGQKIVTTVTGMSSSPAISTPQEFKTKKSSEDPHRTSPQGYACWGENDCFPWELVQKNMKIGVLQAGIELNADMHYGCGIHWQRDNAVDNTLSTERIFPEGWSAMVRNMQVDEILSQVTESLETFGIYWVEVILERGSSKVANLQVMDPVNTRFGIRDKKGRLKEVVYHPDLGIPDRNEPAKKDLIRIPLYDPSLANQPKHFVISGSFMTFGRNYYPEPTYNAIHRNGWAKIAMQVPDVIHNIYCNQMAIKYHVRVDVGTFQVKYGVLWDSPKGKQTEDEHQKWREEKIAEFTKGINDMLTDTENAGKAVVTLRDEMAKLGVEIEPIKNYLDSSSELPNAAAANSEILFALRVDPSIMGLGIPGGKDLSGSGSDKRNSANLKQITLKRRRIITLKWLHVLAKQMNWADDVYPVYTDMNIQTLDDNPAGMQESVG